MNKLYNNQKMDKLKFCQSLSLTDGEGGAGGGLLADGDAVPRDGGLWLGEEAPRGAAVAVAVAHDGRARGLLVGLDATEGALRGGTADGHGQMEDEDVGDGGRPCPEGAAVALQWKGSRTEIRSLDRCFDGRSNVEVIYFSFHQELGK